MGNCHSETPQARALAWDARCHQRASSRGPCHASGFFAWWGGSRGEESAPLEFAFATLL